MRSLDIVLHGGGDENATCVSQSAACWCLTHTLLGEESVTVRLFGCKKIKAPLFVRASLRRAARYSRFNNAIWPAAADASKQTRTRSGRQA